jgi:cell wall-associated NlpC family hydrolase
VFTPALRGRARLRALSLLVLLTTALGVAGTAAPAQAATMSYRSSVVNEAAHHNGAPYQYGAAGPTRFDCSGYTRYVFAKFHKSLPHNAAQQYSVVRHLSKSSMVAGDLIFFRNSSGRISHVAIYAGAGTMWHSPHSGSTVSRIKIYSSNYLVGRP